MPKDLREMLQNEPKISGQLSKNHRKSFEAKIQKELHRKKYSVSHFLRIAASVLVVVGLGSSIFYFSNTTSTSTEVKEKITSLGSVSPELKKIENYYIASINTEISNLEPTPENRDLLDGYLEKIGELTQDYKLLTNELNTEGVNEKTINALIDNLQLRLKLLSQLKEQLNKLKKLNIIKNENVQV